VSTRTGERTLRSSLPVTELLADRRGRLRMGALTYGVDVATGMAMGSAVLAQDLWVVTTDLDVHLAAPVWTGTVRIDVEVLRAGATTAVAAFSLYDDGSGRTVGGGTATGRPFPFAFDRSFLEIPVGTAVDRAQGRPTGEVPAPDLVAALGMRVGEDASVEVDVADWLRNPWGILHGGVTACLVDVAADLAGSTALGRDAWSSGQMLRYLAPGRVGPVRAVPSVRAIDGARALIETRVHDVGAEGRLLAVGTSELTAAPTAP
jgi:acyl-coenzyme A thioesterase PaaI-like protein